LGVSEVAKNNFLFAAYTDWCEATLLKLFNDKDENVRKSAAGCFGISGIHQINPKSEVESMLN
jgi:hypothetical protein